MILDRIFGDASGQLSNAVNPERWFVEWIRGGLETASGVGVNEATALGYSAVWAATCVLTESIASLPCLLYERVGNGKERAREHPLFRILRDEPNSEMDSFAFWAQQALCLVNWGNMYAEKERLLNGELHALWPLHAKRVKPYRRDDGKIEYEIHREDGSLDTPATRNDLFHVAGRLSEDGITGKGVIAQARESIGLGIATEQFGAALFGNGAVPGGFITRPGDQEPIPLDRERELVGMFNAKFQSSKNAHKIGLLQEGMTFTANHIPPEDAQFLQTRQFNVTEISRWYRIPPHLLFELSRSTFSNIEHQGMEFVTYSIQPWLVRIERAITKQLIEPDEKDTYFAEFLMDALLRGDAVSRANAWQIRFMNGAANIDEWRASDNLNPLPEDMGQTHFVPANLMPLKKAINPPPPASAPFSSPSVPQDDDEEEDEQSEDDDTQDQSSEIARQWYAEVMGRMIHMEINEVRRAAKEPSKFLDRLNDWYAKHVLAMQDALARPLDAMGILPVVVVSGHVRQSQEDLLRAAECQPAELEARVAECVAGWDNRRFWKE